MVSKRKGDDRMLKKFIMVVVLIMATVVFTGFSEAAMPKWVLIHDAHHVVEGETLDSIARDYMKKNTYGPRGFDEFREGIIDLNNLRDNLVVYPGQELRINYWVTPEEILNR
jgi:hypothetical protein